MHMHLNQMRIGKKPPSSTIAEHQSTWMTLIHFNRWHSNSFLLSLSVFPLRKDGLSLCLGTRNLTVPAAVHLQGFLSSEETTRGFIANLFNGCIVRGQRICHKRAWKKWPGARDPAQGRPRVQRGESAGKKSSSPSFQVDQRIAGQ